MAGVRKKARTKGGKYQGWFTDSVGKRRFFSGASDRTETLKMARRLEDEHRQVRLGYRPAQSSADRHRGRPITEVGEEYLSWGESQGGRNGHPWGETHARNRRTHLSWWKEQLGIETLADMPGVLPRVEAELQGLQRLGRTGKTVSNYAEALSALCDWCVQRGYLTDDPLRALAPFDTTPQTTRRAMTGVEIIRLLESCAAHRRVLYETAFLSGLRAKELRSLTVDHLDPEQGGFRLDAAWTKNRRAGFQQLPIGLVERLKVFARSGEATRLYAQFYRRSDKRARLPEKPLLYVPSHAARDLGKDLDVAGIPKNAPGGKLDFHACRVAYVTLVSESGATVKETQELARHSTPQLTMNVYARTRQDRLKHAVERVGEVVLSEANRAPSVHKLAVGAEAESATPFDNRELRFPKLVEAAGVEPASENSPLRPLRA